MTKLAKSIWLLLAAAVLAAIVLGFSVFLFGPLFWLGLIYLVVARPLIARIRR